MRVDEVVDAPPAPPPPERSRRWGRLACFVALCVACVLVSLSYLVHARGRNPEVPAADLGRKTAVASSVEVLRVQPHVAFRSMVPGEAGRLALAPLATPDGPRLLTDLRCVRIYVTTVNGLCLTDDGALFTPYDIVFLGPDLKPRHKEALAGLISRARVSPDGRYGSATVFVTGHSYAPNTFSTQTTLYDMASGELLADLEHFEVYKAGSLIESPDFNFWGVTFAKESGLFYATLGTAGHSYLVRGDVESLTMEVLRDGVECPSLSPDNTRIAFKQRVPAGLGPVEWRPAVLDLTTLRDHPLAEDRSVDDQIEWLDDDTVLYALDTGDGAPGTWSIEADGAGAPQLFLHDANSPAVVAG